ncbi:hypothetical protein [Mycolicibacterium stellerae]|uniref:hypothetical protein n=1 Tax=Mycolicibacterium stellerae TaxID=2358193 RepID=UPI0013DE5CB5|nr:hypothetical protein [Mycolicibacterium stellerae]
MVSKAHGWVSGCTPNYFGTENATQRKLNAIADTLADLMDELGADTRNCAVLATN